MVFTGNKIFFCQECSRHDFYFNLFARKKRVFNRPFFYLRYTSWIRMLTTWDCCSTFKNKMAAIQLMISEFVASNGRFLFSYTYTRLIHFPFNILSLKFDCHTPVNNTKRRPLINPVSATATARKRGF